MHYMNCFNVPFKIKYKCGVLFVCYLGYDDLVLCHRCKLSVLQLFHIWVQVKTMFDISVSHSFVKTSFTDINAFH